MAHRVWTRPRRPYLQGGQGICRGLIMASCPGSEMGFSVDDNSGPWEDKWRRGKNNASNCTAGAGVPSATNYEHTEEYASHSLDDGLVTFDYRGASTLRFTFSQGISAFFCGRWEGAAGDSNSAVFKQRAGGLGVAQNGWDIRFINTNVWQANICDGATNVAATGTLATTFGNTTRANVVVGFTYDRVNLRLFVNGIQDAVVATALDPSLISSNNAPKWFGTGVAATDIANAAVGMGAVWNRALTRGEVSSLYTDPFGMWRGLDEDVGNLGIPQTFLLSF